MQCTLLVPPFLTALLRDHTTRRKANLPILRKMLSRARRERLDTRDVESWLLAEHGVARQFDWPVAPYRRLAEEAVPDAGYWLCCDPVHLIPRRGELVCDPGMALAPSQEEAQALVATLNDFFRNDGLDFQAPAPDRWYLRLPAPVSLKTRSPGEIVGLDIRQCLPSGDTGLAWHARLNEMQMLLHAHPVNQAREHAEIPTINSVWLWGGGTFSAPARCPYSALWSDDPLARGLARACGAETHASSSFPGEFSSWLAHANTNAHALLQIAANQLESPSENDGSLASGIETLWLAPLYRALKNSQIETLTLITFDGKGVYRFDVTRRDSWKFWRSFPRTI